MSSKNEVAVAKNRKDARASGDFSSIPDQYPRREVDIETLRKVTDLVIELHWDALKELEHR